MLRKLGVSAVLGFAILGSLASSPASAAGKGPITTKTPNAECSDCSGDGGNKGGGGDGGGGGGDDGGGDDGGGDGDTGVGLGDIAANGGFSGTGGTPMGFGNCPGPLKCTHCPTRNAVYATFSCCDACGTCHTYSCD